eukprot:gene5283-6123_t
MESITLAGSVGGKKDYPIECRFEYDDKALVKWREGIRDIYQLEFIDKSAKSYGYVIGGETDPKSMMIYCIATNQWHKGPSMTASVERKHLGGGVSTGYSRLAKFNIRTLKTVKLADPTFHILNSHTFFYQGSLYGVGGYNGKDVDKIYKINMATSQAFNIDYQLSLVNAQRQRQGLDPLAKNLCLCRSAEAHSTYQAKNNIMTHNDPLGGLFERVEAFGADGMKVAENVAMGQPTDDAVMKAWMGSSGHRANILNPGFTSFGASMKLSSRGQKFWTQQFLYGSCNGDEFESKLINLESSSDTPQATSNSTEPETLIGSPISLEKDNTDQTNVPSNTAGKLIPMIGLLSGLVIVTILF